MAVMLTGLIAVVVAAVVGAFVVMGAERFWGLFGPPDLGPVAFETLVRRTSPNDSLACPAGLCGARSDFTPPVYPVSASDLQRVFAGVIAAEQKVVRVGADPALRTERFVQRTPMLGFPDTIVVRFVDLPDGRSTLALYSRSQLGRSDLGANQARLRRWLDKLDALVPPAAPRAN